MGAPRAAKAEHAEWRMTWSLTPFFAGMPALRVAASVQA
jgi:hypothetical protein